MSGCRTREARTGPGRSTPDPERGANGRAHEPQQQQPHPVVCRDPPGLGKKSKGIYSDVAGSFETSLEFTWIHLADSPSYTVVAASNPASGSTSPEGSERCSSSSTRPLRAPWRRPRARQVQPSTVPRCYRYVWLPRPKRWTRRSSGSFVMWSRPCIRWRSGSSGAAPTIVLGLRATTTSWS